MNAVEFLKIKNRMCHQEGGCVVCPYGNMISCNAYEDDEIEEIVRKAEEWEKDHPIKTRQSEFLKMFPNAIKDKNGILHILPCALEAKYKSSSCDSVFCSECRKNYWLQEVE